MGAKKKQGEEQEPRQKLQVPWKGASSRASAERLARVDEYRTKLEQRGWIFSPPTPEQPLNSLLPYLTIEQRAGLESFIKAS